MKFSVPCPTLNLEDQDLKSVCASLGNLANAKGVLPAPLLWDTFCVALCCSAVTCLVWVALVVAYLTASFTGAHSPPTPV